MFGLLSPFAYPELLAFALCGITLYRLLLFQFNLFYVNFIFAFVMCFCNVQVIRINYYYY